MRAAWYEKYGPAREVFQVGDMPTPVAGPGEVLVRVHASGVNPSDWKSRTGSRGPELPYPRIVPHSDGSGVIEAVGDGVDAGRVGERVWLYEGQWQRPFGTAAEYAALPSEHAVRLADSVGFDEAASIGIPVMTAHRCLMGDGPVAGMNVLVTGGAGAVGNYAVQLAKWAGATVIATVSSEEKAAHAMKGGADHVVSYRTEDVGARVLDLTGGKGVDRIVDVDFGANLPVTEQVLAANGSVGCYASTREREPVVRYQFFSRRNASFRFVLVYSMPDAAKRQAADDITQAIADGALWHPIGARFPLEEIAAAHEAQESDKVIGNIVVEVA
jgi:NADPH2:quinone reductase